MLLTSLASPACAPGLLRHHHHLQLPALVYHHDSLHDQHPQGDDLEQDVQLAVSFRPPSDPPMCTFASADPRVP